MEQTQTDLGSMGVWRATLVARSGFMYPRVTYFDASLGREVTRSLRVYQSKRLLVLDHARTNARVVFSSYLHRGKLRYRDFRYKIAHPTSTVVIDEICRLTNAPKDHIESIMCDHTNDPTNPIPYKELV